MNDDSHQLLMRYHRDRSEEAFRSLVDRHAPAVFATALRRLGGDRGAAQEVTQDVFQLLARKSGSLGGVVIPGWLYRQTCRRASNHVRSETRRRQREQAAMSRAPEPSGPERELKETIDEALMALPAKDRDALVLRYFEWRTYRGVGAALGLAEEAARKRVTRALAKLESALIRRGAVSGVLAAVPLEAFRAPALPEPLVAAITRKGCTEASAISGLSLVWVQPILLGALVGSLVTVPVLSLRDREPAPEVSGPLTATARPETAQRRLVVEGEHSSLEAIITEIRHAHAGPQHALGILKLKAVLDRIPLDQIPEFFALAKGSLSDREKAACYERLLERWSKVDDAAALTLALEENLGAEVNPTKGTNLLGNLFSTMGNRSRDDARSWLLDHWAAEPLGESAFLGTLRVHLATNLADMTLHKDGAEAFLELVASFPDEGAQRKVLEGVVHDSPWAYAVDNMQGPGLAELHRALVGLPDQRFSEDLAISLWQKALQNQPEEVEEALLLMTPPERYLVELARLGVPSRPSTRTETLDGGTTQSFEQIDPLVFEAETIAAGRSAGLSREEIVTDVGRIILKTAPEEKALHWIAEHREEVNLDGLIVQRIGEIGLYSGALIGGEGPEQRLIRLVDHLRDRETRAVLSRAAYRRILARSEEEAATFLKSAALSAELRQELIALSEEW